MADLVFSILFSSLIFVIFKLFVNYRVQTPYGIIANYVVACLVGLILYDGEISLGAIYLRPWFTGTLLLGVLFIVVFNLMAKTSQVLGVSVASVATKMSLAIPVVLGMMLYGEELGPLKVLGIILALGAVYFSSVKESKMAIRKKGLILPLLVFLGSGVIDSSIKFLEETRVPREEFPLFSASIFGAAAITGLLFMGIKSLKSPLQINIRNVLGGIALGIPNFFSIFFLLRALQNEVLNSASIFTINNVAIVMLSTLLGIVLFKEKLSILNWGGIAMAVVSIFLVALF